MHACLWTVGGKHSSTQTLGKHADFTPQCQIRSEPKTVRHLCKPPPVWASMPPTFTGNAHYTTSPWLCKICLSCCGKENATTRADWKTNMLLRKKNYVLNFFSTSASDCTALYCTHWTGRLREPCFIGNPFCLCHGDPEANQFPTIMRPEYLRHPHQGLRSWDEVHIMYISVLQISRPSQMN